MQDPLLEQLQARKERKNYAIVTIVDSFGSTPRTNGKMLVYENGLSKGTVGGGHVGRSLIRIAKEAGFDVLLVDNRDAGAIALHAVLDREWSYAGMIGSRAKIQAIFSQRRELGYSGARLAEVHTPIGLALGGEPPVEIAVAIMAEIIAVQHGKIQNFS